MAVSAIVAAGGHGTRFGGGELKQLRLIGGRAVLDRSVSAFVAHPLVAEVIVALPQDLVDDPPPYLCDRTHAGKPLRLVAGGARRQDSVANAFQAAAAGSDVIVIHDAARPFVTADVIARTIEAAYESGAAVAALQARDTVKQGELVVRQAHHERKPDPLILSPPPFDGAQGDREPVERSKDERGWTVTSTLPRETIFLAQTPQAFRRDVLIAAFELAARTNAEGTDEAALAERAGHTVRLVEGDVSNIKITTPEDLLLAEAIAARSAEASRSTETDADGARGSSRAPARTGRAGTGYDLHRLVAGRPLVIGGITIPSDRGALGHSDADVACHAITDAILGAAGLGDIGRHFPDSDPRWKGASSLDLLARACAMVRDTGLDVGNVDVTVVLEAPKIRDHIPAMRDAIARAIDIDPARVSLKGKTNEGVDAVGRGEAIAAHAIALVRAR
jgi:2-C-methyl-D-erythritol 4-phosphate cytidylyltransferase / 2-C-methyl-D-erythritol 2,4-cyclodiphosphate synthase